MDDIEGPDVLDATDDLLHDEASFFLLDVLTDFQEDAQIVAIRILLHHVDVRACFDSLVKAHGMLRTYHAVNAHLLMDAVKIVLTYVCDLNDLASVDLLCWINS